MSTMWCDELSTRVGIGMAKKSICSDNVSGLIYGMHLFQQHGLVTANLKIMNSVFKEMIKVLSLYQFME